MNAGKRQTLRPRFCMLHPTLLDYWADTAAVHELLCYSRVLTENCAPNGNPGMTSRPANITTT